ncbi:hypothetical protein BCR33DRAFT_449942 [Rhizoclosmatium globosum]|uniref:Autophagy-related protein 2 n=1 Tax=Rhizoclosmatium globosum TaxID=329046 RepID=A0A1Y2BSF5_9FUNG|nr:hypothetical protein BCR33DRAFT_449942 [Rhizoclosmatium globosum]|eukprot:ORY37689.1 hypothetical protein BCR33DRAFT_449942 [Rhizoclosmatium globosum]
MPFPFSLVLRADEIGIRLFDASEGNGAVLDWAYVIQMAESHVVFISKAGGDMEAHVEMDTISFSNMEGQAVLLRSEVLKEKRPMISVSFKSIYDSLIHMKENTVAVAISELRVVVVDSILASLAKDFSAFLKEPAGLTPIELVDAVTKVSLILNGAVLDYRPMYRSFRATVVLKRVKLLLNMIPHSPTFGITITIHDFALHLLKSSSSISFEIDEPRLMIDKGLVEYLRQCRYAQVLSCDLLEVSFRQTKGLDGIGRTEVEVSNGYAYLDVCMDSYRLLMDILGYIGEGGDGQYNSDRHAKIVGEKGVGIDLSNVPDMDVMMESVDETAFAKFVPLTQKPSREYNESEVQGADVFDGAISISDPRSVSQKAEILVYDNGPFEYYEDYFSLTGTPGGIEDITVPDKVPPLIHIKVKDVNIILRMFDGFDFPIRDFVE